MNKQISWYIKRFFYELKNEGISRAFCKTYLYCKQKIFIHIKLPTPKAQCISFLRIVSYFPQNARRKALLFIGDNHEKSYSLDGAYTIPYGREKKYNNSQVVLLAHWDPANIVDPYVLHMAQQLKQLGKKIILCSAAPLAALPQDLDWFDAIVCRTCSGYDFTSWKAAFEAFPSLYEAEEVTLCNDSVFAPIGSYAPVYQTMSTISCDFWGLTYSSEVMPHIQSFHIVLRKKAVQHPSFKQFISSITTNNNRDVAIGYEVRFSLWLELHGLQAGCYRPYHLHINTATNPVKQWKTCLNDGIPILKLEYFKTQGRTIILPQWRYEVEKHNYPAYLITNYFYRIGIDISPVLCPGNRSNTWPPSVFVRNRPLNTLKKSSNIKKLKIAVIIHCFYPEIFPILARYLKNLPEESHIYISTDTKEKQNYIQNHINHMAFSQKEIRVYPNKGWDIAPFLAGFNDIIHLYDLICKVHAKASTNISKDRSIDWRTMLYESLLGNKDHVQKIIKAFEGQPELGMVAPPSLSYCSVDLGLNKKRLLPLLRKMGIKLPTNEAIDFPVGSMFWTRSAALHPLLDLQLTFDDFSNTNANERDGTLAHAIERCFFFSCCKAGYYWSRVSPCK